MPVDTSMYGMIKPIDAMGAVDSGMRMRDMIDERKKKSAVQDAYKQGMKVGPDGKMTMDHSMTASALAQGGYGQEAYQAQQQGQSDQMKQLEAHVKNAQYGAQLYGAARNQQEWDMAEQKLVDMGLPTQNIPREFSPENQRMLVESSMTLNERLNEQYRRDALASSSADRREARDERRFQQGIKMEEKEQALATPFGKANTPDDAKKLKDSHEMKTGFDRNLQEMISLRKKHGGGAVMNREDVGRGKALSKDLLLQYKELAKLGVLSQADEAILNAIIPADPLAYNSPMAAVQGQDPILHKMTKFKQDSDSDFKTRVGTRTREGLAAGTGPADDVAAYAKAHGISYDQALSVKQKRMQTAGK